MFGGRRQREGVESGDWQEVGWVGETCAPSSERGTQSPGVER